MRWKVIRLWHTIDTRDLAAVKKYVAREVVDIDQLNHHKQVEHHEKENAEALKTSFHGRFTE